MLTGVVKDFSKKGHGMVWTGEKAFFLHKNYMQKGQGIPANGDLVEFRPYAVMSPNPHKRDLALNVRIVAKATR